MTVRKIISGGQDGADHGGLIAGETLGLETGGTMPQGFRTKSGAHPERAERFHLTEHASRDYPPRTLENVVNSDATVRLALRFSSPGERLTLRYCTEQDKPMFDVKLWYDQAFLFFDPAPQALREWLDENNVEVLNVAGNARVDITTTVADYLVAALGPEQP